MNISGSNIGANAQSPFKNVSKNNGENTGKSASNSVLDQLRTRREEITKQKNALIAKTSKENNPLESIREQIKAYDQQIYNIESQISTEMAAMAKEALENQKGDKGNENIKSSNPKTEQEADNDKMALVAKLGYSMESVKNIDSIKNKFGAEASIVEQEREMDTERRDLFIETVAKTNPEAAQILQKKGLSITTKEDKLSGLKDRILELSKALGKEVGEIQQEIEDSRLQDKLHTLLDKWNKAEAGGVGENEAETGNEDSVKPPTFLEEAFRTASKTATDFLEKYKDWSKEADEQKLSGDNKTAFMYDKLNQWEEKLKSSSPSEYAAWKQITMSVDVFA